jgi:hypothetical protein
MPNIETTYKKDFWERLSSGGGITGGGFAFHCGAVSTMGQGDTFAGLPFGIDTGDDIIDMSTQQTEYTLLGMKKTLPNVEQFIQGIDITCAAGTTESYTWRLLLNPTLSAALTYNPVPNHYLEYAVGDGAITVTNQGHVMYSGVGISRSNKSVSNISKALRIGRDLAGNYDELVLSYTPHNNGQDVAASINGIMI